MSRTTQRTGPPLLDPYVDREREWTPAEQLEALNRYKRGQDLTQIAVGMQIDKRQVVIALTRLLLSPTGEIEDIASAPNHGKSYSRGDRDRMVEAHLKGRSISQIASEFDRTQLAIGWQLLDSKRRPVVVPDELITELRGRADAQPSLPGNHSDAVTVATRIVPEASSTATTSP